MSTLLGIITGIVVVLVLIVITTYNRLVKLRNNREEAFSNIDVQLKQRLDLVPQLVETVKGYAKHESGTFEKITEARSQSMGAQTIDQKIAADTQLSNALAGMRIQVEAYPELKANTNFMHLQEELADIENKLAAVRRYFNSATKELNTSVEVFPAVLIAGMFGFHKETMYDLGAERAAAEQAPKINF